MRASRIFAFARTIRCASVGAGVRNACAICSVVRPHTSRSVSATCASGASAGWQHVKMRRSRSSSTLSSSAHAAASMTPISASLAHVVERIEPRAASQAVDRLESSGRNEPGAGICGNAVARPLLERRPERVLQRFFGDVEVAQQADQRREHAPGMGDIDLIHRFVYGVDRGHGDRSDHLRMDQRKWVSERSFKDRRTVTRFLLSLSLSATRVEGASVTRGRDSADRSHPHLPVRQRTGDAEALAHVAREPQSVARIDDLDRGADPFFRNPVFHVRAFGASTPSVSVSRNVDVRRSRHPEHGHRRRSSPCP